MGYGLWVMGYGLWVVGCGLWVVGYGLWVMGYGLWVMGCGLCVFPFALFHYYLSKNICNYPTPSTQHPILKEALP